ncbi:ABC-type cobalt transport system, ATPase component [Candidatus Phytoplasma mali]|uniref:ABC-type cobalt transport system, ATPase component n=1 Tax=Phytoplasma mali (strain AT) TaxID=482235 RepID=B3R020_PHYMT|nr:ATP-binding cassette domain-containing protein [Candidatus Phytoplasma mali]CAP18557.1 ABC-type cobalt transport system, ATPase component [Candidatus Phytoplasma mali]
MAIQFEKVKYFYDKKNKISSLKDINLSIKPEGEFIALIGKIGSGKTTLVQLMNALLITDIGKIIIFNQLINSKTKKKKLVALKKQIGLVFQFPEYQLFEISVLKDVMFAPENFTNDYELSKQKSIQVLKKIGISEDLFDKSPFQISDGQQRKVAIAGVLAMEPDILILDEPTRGLDSVSKKNIMNFFKEIYKKQKKTIIMITHDIDLVAEYASRILFLKQGELVFDGNKETFFESDDFSKFDLDYPQTFKILKHLQQTIGIPFEYKYCFKTLLEYLKKIYL